MKKSASIIITATILIASFAATVSAQGNKKELIRFPTSDVSKELMTSWYRTNAQRSSDKGIPSNQILTLRKTKDYLYIGMPNGFSRYNPTSGTLKTYTVADNLGENLVSIIAEDAKGKLWIGGADSLAKMEGDTISDYSNLSLFEQVRPLGSYLQENGNLWLTASNGLYLQSAEGNWSVLTNSVPSVFRAIVVDKNGTLWGGGTALYSFPLGERGLGALLKDNWETYLPLDSNVINITALEVDDTNTLWIGTADRGFFTYSIPTNEWSHDSKTVIGAITRISKGSGSEIWIGSTEGLWKRENSVWLHLGEQNSMPEDHVTALIVEEDSIWIGTHENGLVRVQKGYVENITTGGVTRRKLSLDEKQKNELKKVEIQQDREARISYEQEQQAINQTLGPIFTDLQRSDRIWIRDVIISLRSKGIFAEVERFNPEQPTLWEQLLKMGIVAAQISISDQPIDYAPSTRVPVNNWATPYIWKALKNQVIERDDIETDFEKPVTRYRALDILFKIFNIQEEEITATEFVDLDPTQVSLVETAVKLGFVQGFTLKNELTVKASQKYDIYERLLTRSSIGVNVETVQNLLKELGFYTRSVTGEYDEPTVNAVADYQLNRGIFTQDQVNAGDAEGFGAIGKETRERLRNEDLSTGLTDSESKYFKPNDIFNRAQMAVVLKKILER